jgi:tetratricopeptide (TPR) repeat protein
MPLPLLLIPAVASALGGAGAFFLQRRGQKIQENQVALSRISVDNQRQNSDIQLASIQANLAAIAEELKVSSQERAADRAITIQEKEKDRALTAYVERLRIESQFLIHRDNIALRKWEQEKTRELALLRGEIDGRLTIMRLREESKLVVEQMREKHRQSTSPTRTLGYDMVEEHARLDDPYALMVLYSPPKIHYDPSVVVNNISPRDFPDCEYELEHELMNFQMEYESRQRSILLKTGEWNSDYIRGTAAIGSLYREAHMIPTMVLDISINQTKAFANVSYWAPDFKRYLHFPASKPILWRELGDHTAEFFSLFSRLWMGLIADTHYLVHIPIDRRKSPLLPTLLSDLLQNLEEEESLTLVSVVVKHYEGIYAALAEDEPLLIASLRLDLVLALAKLPQQMGAQQQLQASLQNWLQPYDVVVVDELDVLLDAVEGLLGVSDRPYVDQLNQCLKAIGHERCLDIAAACYHRGLERYGRSEYDIAVGDFNQTIQLVPQADAYFERGRCYFRLKQWAEAIGDFDRAISLQPQRAELYEWRGDVHAAQYEDETALANYHQAVQLGSMSATGKRDFLQDKRSREQRQQQAAAAAQKRAEDERQVNASAALERGNQALDGEDFEGAIVAFEEAVQLGLSGAVSKLKEAREQAAVLDVTVDLGNGVILGSIPGWTYAEIRRQGLLSR